MSGNHHQLSFDTSWQRDSVVHRAPTALKASVAMALVAVASLIPMHPLTIIAFFAPGFLLLMAVTGLSLLPVAALFRRLLVMELFAACVVVLALFQPHGGFVFGGLILRSTFCVLTMILLSSTTSPEALIGWIRSIGLPTVFVGTIAFAYRYLHVLSEETQRMRRARASRTFTPQRRRVWLLNANIIGHLFVRTSARAERVYAAMCARGWR